MGYDRFAAKHAPSYKECSADYKSRRLLIKADWVEKNVPGFGAASPAPAKQAAATTTVKSVKVRG